MRSLNKNEMKYIAVIAMLIDHIGMLFVPISTPLGLMMRSIGRLTAPTMCLFIAEGYSHTSDKKKYGLRLLTFALISQLPYLFLSGKSLLSLEFNMIFTLLMAFLALLCLDKISNKLLRICAIALVTALSYYGDWGVTAVLWSLMFYVFRDTPDMQAKGYAVLSAGYVAAKGIEYMLSGMSFFSGGARWGVFLFIPFLMMYNGEPGSRSRFSKWFFYIFYPLHMVILRIIFEYTV